MKKKIKILFINCLFLYLTQYLKRQKRKIVRFVWLSSVSSLHSTRKRDGCTWWCANRFYDFDKSKKVRFFWETNTFFTRKKKRKENIFTDLRWKLQFDFRYIFFFFFIEWLMSIHLLNKFNCVLLQMQFYCIIKAKKKHFLILSGMKTN